MTPGSQRRWLLLGTLATLALSAAAPATREAGVATTKLTLRDAKRARNVSVAAAYPTEIPDATTLPFVILSHNADSGPRSLDPLMRRIAAAGYVAVVPAHLDFSAVARERSAPPSKKGDPAQWADRIADLEFVLDQTPTLDASLPALKGHLDPARIAVVGHGTGAYGALALAGATPTWDGVKKEFRDKRVAAVILISPPRPGEEGLTPESFKLVSAPALFLTGTLDVLTSGEKPDQKRKAYDLSPAPDKYLVTFKGGNRLSYLGLTPAQQKFSDATADLSITFLDAYLKSDEGKKDMMISGSVIAKHNALAALEGK